jgi:hypothetical protein
MYFTITRLYREKNLDEIKDYMEEYNIRDKDEIYDEDINDVTVMDIAEEIAEKYANKKEQEQKTTTKVEEVEEKLNESKQVNNMKIKYNKIYNKYQVITPDGRTLEEFDTEEDAINWAKEQKDFIVKTEAEETKEETGEEIKEPELEITPELEKQLTKNDIKELKDIDLNDNQKEYLAYYNISKEEIIEGLKDIANDLKYYSANEPFISIKEYIEELVNL